MDSPAVLAIQSCRIRLCSRSGNASCGVDHMTAVRHPGLLNLVNMWPNGVTLLSTSETSHTQPLEIPIEIDDMVFLGYGALWDVFLLPTGTLPGINEPSVLRLCHISSMPTSIYDTTDGWNEEAALAAIEVEHKAMSEHLVGLQGRVVPQYHGLWIGAGAAQGLIASLQSWAGHPIVPDEQPISEDDQQLIKSHYRELHEAGVVHQDVAFRHWLKHPDGRIFIIDFDTCWLLEAPPASREGKSEDADNVDNEHKNPFKFGAVALEPRWSKLVVQEDKRVARLMTPRRPTIRKR